jgi:hypothetical protein
MAIRIIINALLVIGLAALQVAFISGLPGWFSSLNLILAILIFILGFVSFNFALWWSVAVGFMLEIFSFSPFGVYLVGLSLTIIIANFLLNHFFTNRSLYSFLALAALATLIYELLRRFFILLFTQASGSFFLARVDFWLLVFKQIVMNLLFTFTIYYLVHFLGKNLRPVFLIKKRKH